MSFTADQSYSSIQEMGVFKFISQSDKKRQVVDKAEQLLMEEIMAVWIIRPTK